MPTIETMTITGTNDDVVVARSRSSDAAVKHRAGCRMTPAFSSWAASPLDVVKVLWNTSGSRARQSGSVPPQTRFDGHRFGLA